MVAEAVPEPADGDLTRLAVRAADGDERAVEELLSEVRDLVHRYCRSRLGTLPAGHHAADDAAQDVCLAVLTSLPRYRHQGKPFEAFVFRIAARRVADALRGLYRDAVPVDEVPDTTSAEPTPEELAMQTSDVAVARELLSRLPAQQRHILTLRVGEGLSAAETADLLGISAVAVRVGQHRALTRLRELTVPLQRSWEGVH
ncbi:MAG: RNA polymerase sigma factor ShbA [Actinomycetes bacterium]